MVRVMFKGIVLRDRSRLGGIGGASFLEQFKEDPWQRPKQADLQEIARRGVVKVIR
jgi:hypothetical protein